MIGLILFGQLKTKKTNLDRNELSLEQAYCCSLCCSLCCSHWMSTYVWLFFVFVWQSFVIISSSSSGVVTVYCKLGYELNTALLPRIYWNVAYRHRLIVLGICTHRQYYPLTFVLTCHFSIKYTAYATNHIREGLKSVLQRNPYTWHLRPWNCPVHPRHYIPTHNTTTI